MRRGEACALHLVHCLTVIEALFQRELFVRPCTAPHLYAQYQAAAAVSLNFAQKVEMGNEMKMLNYFSKWLKPV